MNLVGVPVGGLKTVGQIVATNSLTFRGGQNALAIAVELLSTHTAGAPVVDSEGKHLGFINEFAVHAGTTIEDAAKRMEEQCVLNLPVEKDGRVISSVSRHDLLRAWIGLGLGMGLDP